MPLREALFSNFRRDKNLKTSLPHLPKTENGQADLSVSKFKILAVLGLEKDVFPLL